MRLAPLSASCLLVALLGGLGRAEAQSTPETFLPPEQPLEIGAVEISGALTIDGKLDEPEWLLAPPASGFVQQNPKQGQAASFPTEVRVLYNQQFLYIGAVCYDDFRERSHLRVQNLSRDFNWNLNDNFGIAIDGFQDQRNAISFQTTPHGNLRDLQVIDGSTFNIDWDALWYCRTQVADTAWYVEMAIPWKTLRYPEGADKIGVVFMRNIRRNNEYAVLPAVPRVFTPYRMAYAAVLTGLRPPKPSANLQINTYLLAALRSNIPSSLNGRNSKPSMLWKRWPRVRLWPMLKPEVRLSRVMGDTPVMKMRSMLRSWVPVLTVSKKAR
jgi:hypothetical protein